MKKLPIVLSTLIASAFLFAMVLVSCNKDPEIKYNGTFIDPCVKDTCYNGGVCLNGECICPSGYEGKQCLTTWNERYVASYEVNDNCNPNNNYNISIAPLVGEATGIIINDVKNVCSSPLSLVSKISGANTNVVIPFQRACGDIYISGTATQTMDKKYINIYLESRDSMAHTSKYCSLVARRLN
jgi:hypothetical protein